jgi:sterol O-acyltransferase
LDDDGTARLQPDLGRSEPPRSLKQALDAVADTRRGSSSDGGSESQSEEDYDALKHDPNTIVKSGKGGGFTSEANGNGTTSTSVVETSFQEIKSSSLKPRPSAARLKSIPVTLNKLEEKGRYILTADDDALRKILRIGIERVGDFSDLFC